jgi:hypothetical protein
MKTRDIRRGIVSTRTRNIGEEPSMGRVSRLHRTRKKKRRSSTGRTARRQLRLRRVLIWSVLIGIVSAGVIAGALVLWLSPKISLQADQAGIVQPEREVQTLITSKFPSPSAEEAMAMVVRMIAIRESSQVEAVVWTNGRSAEEIAAYFAGREQRDGKVLNYQWMGSIDSGNVLMDGIVVVSQREDVIMERMAILAPDEAGVWKIDFDAFARTVVPSWDEIIHRNAPSAQVRVVAIEDSYYNGPYGDEAQWVCYAIGNRDIDFMLYAYCPRGSAVADQMRSIFDDGEMVSRVTLEIRRVPGAESKQFEIVRVMAKDWVVRPPAGS